jgi:hypothetical protein
MNETALSAWSNFYVMTGSSAAALIGLMFVVITLVVGEERARRSPEGITAFSTPTVLHFSSALLVSAILNAPWKSLGPPGTLIGIVAICGAAYVLRATYIAARVETYTPDAEDWTWYTVLPVIAYGVFLASAIAVHLGHVGALFGFGGAAIMLIFIGIRNAWDVVTFLATGGSNNSEKPSP